MDGTENAGFRTGIRPPTNFAASVAKNGLNEITDSQTNMRANACLPVSQQAMKRPSSEDAPPPEAKRKTLVRRAGEPLQSKSQLPPPKTAGIPRSTVKGTSMAALATTTKAVGHGRNASTNFFGVSVGPGTRPPMACTNFAQSFQGRPRGMCRPPRPATSMDDRASEAETNNQNAFDIDERMLGIESQFKIMKETMDCTMSDRKALEEAVELAKSRVTTLDRERDETEQQKTELRREVGRLQEENQNLKLAMEETQRRAKYEFEDALRDHRREMQEHEDNLRRISKGEEDRLLKEHRDKLEALAQHSRIELDEARVAQRREMNELKSQVADLNSQVAAKTTEMSIALQAKEGEAHSLRATVEILKGELDSKKTLIEAFATQMAAKQAAYLLLENRNRGLEAQVKYLESDSKQQIDSFAAMEAKMQEALRRARQATEKLIKEETERRVLFNKYQELKGNIRVMCRVRPVLNAAEGREAKMDYPDEKTSTQIEVTGPEEKNSLGMSRPKVSLFEFDRVFCQLARNEDVFGEISQLIQSALDGYNVCIFAYGQTGSGKTYTMSSEDGMIRRATHMIYDTVEKLREKSWSYTMEGSFVEVYNEELHDLLTTPSDGAKDRKPLMIRHDEQRKQTTVMHCRAVTLDSPDTVQNMLAQAAGNRSVAATRANERSSRSHSVFMLRLAGHNASTGERCEGTLNLVDLAGSERLKQSGAEGDRIKETQSINRSLSCLGDVIEALGKGSSHVPYRNSKLTHLLQYSLGGNSKTLMFVNISPLEQHLRETLTSMRFATKVHNTHIGTAKSTKKTREDWSGGEGQSFCNNGALAKKKSKKESTD